MAEGSIRRRTSLTDREGFGFPLGQVRLLVLLWVAVVNLVQNSTSVSKKKRRGRSRGTASYGDGGRKSAACVHRSGHLDVEGSVLCTVIMIIAAVRTGPGKPLTYLQASSVTVPLVSKRVGPRKNHKSANPSAMRWLPVMASTGIVYL